MTHAAAFSSWRGRMILFLASALLALTASCGGGGGSTSAAGDGDPAAAARTSVIQPGDADCPWGGVLVETGIDENANGVLDADEVDAGEKVCNGSPGDAGLDALVSVEPEAAGDNCPEGGLRIDTGLDVNGNGSLEADEVTRTVFACDGRTGWQGAGQVVPGWVGGSTLWEGLTLATDADGDALVAWPAGRDMLVARYRNGGGWGLPLALPGAPSGFDDGIAQQPVLAVNGSGEAVLAWLEQQFGVFDPDSAIWAARYDPETGWEEPVLFGAPEVERPDSLVVTLDEKGNAMLGWLDTSKAVVFRREAGEADWKQLPDMPQPRDASANPSWLRAAADGDGNVMFLWVQPVGANLESWIWACRYSDAWEDVQAVGALPNPFTDLAVRLAMEPGGQGMAVWSEGGSLLASRYLPDEGWQPEEELRSDTASDATDPHLAAGKSAFVVAWRQGTTDGHILWSRRYGTDGWKDAERVAEAQSNFLEASVGMNDAGKAALVWSDTFNRLRASQQTPDDTWSTPEVIDSGMGSDFSIGFRVLSTAIAVDESDNVIAVWSRNTGLGKWLMYNRWLAP